ncbi:MAG: YqhV family protein [Halanaerobiaceae bacterium]|nr:YqhV family protein [Halanaerobiaceae bacterium]
MNLNNALYIMIFLRLLSSLMEMGAAFLMYYFKNVATAIKINAILGLVGPLILLLVTFVGLVEIRDRLELKNLLLIAAGVILILIGTRN